MKTTEWNEMKTTNENSDQTATKFFQNSSFKNSSFQKFFFQNSFKILPS